MTDRVVETAPEDVPEIPEILEKVMIFALEEGKEKMLNGADVVPFTSLVVKDNLFIESHPGDTSEECFNAARHTVSGARGAEAYAFCYDGYIDTDKGQVDALIAEGGIPGEETGYAIGYLYNVDDAGTLTFEDDEAAYIGEAPNFMEGLKDAEEYADEDIDERYLAEDEVTEFEDEVDEEVAEAEEAEDSDE